MPQNVFLDSRVLVGELALGINTYLGKVYNKKIRGNARKRNSCVFLCTKEGGESLRWNYLNY